MGTRGVADCGVATYGRICRILITQKPPLAKLDSRSVLPKPIHHPETDAGFGLWVHD